MGQEKRKERNRGRVVHGPCLVLSRPPSFPRQDLVLPSLSSSFAPSPLQVDVMGGKNWTYLLPTTDLAVDDCLRVPDVSVRKLQAKDILSRPCEHGLVQAVDGMDASMHDHQLFTRLHNERIHLARIRSASSSSINDCCSGAASEC